MEVQKERFKSKWSLWLDLTFRNAVADLVSALEGIDEGNLRYQEASEYIEKAQYYCLKSEEFTASGNAIAGNYFVLQACDLYAEAIHILQALVSERQIGRPYQLHDKKELQIVLEPGVRIELT
jgi:hypothetical protein